MVDLLDLVLREIRERKEQARAAVTETERLEAALAALDHEQAISGPTAKRPPAPRRWAPAQAARRQPRAVLGVVSERPGVSVGEVAGASGIARATVTSTLARLVADGTLERRAARRHTRIPTCQRALAEPAAAGLPAAAALAGRACDYMHSETRAEGSRMSLLDQVRNLPQQVIDRLKELEPLAREYDQLRKFAQRLGLNYSPVTPNSDDDAQPTPTTRATPKRTRATARSRSAPAKTSKRSSGRTRASTSSAAPRSTRASRERSADSAPATNARSASASGRTRTGRSAAASRQRSGARRATTRPGQRDEDVLRLVGENPGITVREIAEQLGVDATGLYRVVKRLTDDGRLRKDGTRLHPVQAAPPPSPTPPTTADEDAATDALEEVLEESAPADEASPTTAAVSAPTDQT